MVELTAQGAPLTRFRRAIETGSVMLAEMSLREMGTPPLDVALDYVALLAKMEPAKAARAAVRWHSRFEAEASFVTLAESQFALAALAALCEGDRQAIEALRRLLVRTRLEPPNVV